MLKMRETKKTGSLLTLPAVFGERRRLLLEPSPHCRKPYKAGAEKEYFAGMGTVVIIASIGVLPQA